MATARAVTALDIDFMCIDITPNSKVFVSPIKIPDFRQWLSGIQLVLKAHHLNADQAFKLSGLLDVQHVEIALNETSDEKVSIWYGGAEDVDTGSFHALLLDELPGSGVVAGNAYYKITENELSKPEIIIKSGANIDLDLALFSDGESVDLEQLESFVKLVKS